MSTTRGENQWESTCNRFVAYLDIMGFSDRVMRDSHHEIIELMRNLADFGNNLTQIIKDYQKYEDSELKLSIFSDTIMLYSKNDKIETYDLFISAVQSIFSKAIWMNVPLKGVISYGELTVDTKANIFVGKPIVDAHLLHDDVQYYGVVFHHTFDEYIKKHIEPSQVLKFFRDQTTLKSGSITHSNLIWFEHLKFHDKPGDTDTIFYEKMEHLSLSTSGYPRKYIDNTVLMYTKYKERHQL